MNITKADAVLSLRPKTQWVMRDDDLEWHDTEQTQPTEAELTTEIARLQADYEAKEYQRQRAAAYPSMADQLDLLYHGGMDAWKAAITAVKQEFPK